MYTLLFILKLYNYALLLLSSYKIIISSIINNYYSVD